MPYDGRMPLETIIGIDPGGAGAIAALTPEGDLLDVVDMPVLGSEPIAIEVLAIVEAMGRRETTMIALEEPYAASANSAARSLAQGIGYGVLVGVVGAMQYRHERIAPGDWKRHMGLIAPKGSTAAHKKKMSRQRAAQLWPDMAYLWEKQSQDGRAEAALIGESLRRRMLGS